MSGKYIIVIGIHGGDPNPWRTETRDPGVTTQITQHFNVTQWGFPGIDSSQRILQRVGGIVGHILVALTYSAGIYIMQNTMAWGGGMAAGEKIENQEIGE